MKNVRKVMSLLLATMLLLSVIPTAAIDELTDSEWSVTTGEGVTGDNEVLVTVTKGSTYTVTIPKTVILSGSNGEGKYTISVTGDLSGTEAIFVVPYTNEGLNLLENNNSFELNQAGKNPATAKVTQPKTEWSYGNLEDGEGTIKATGLTAGSWNGSFKFNISRGASTTVVTMLDGDGQTVNTFAMKDVRFRSSAPMDELESVQINGEIVSPSNYVVTEGSTIVTFKSDYIESLDAGNYNVNINSQSGTASGKFTVTTGVPNDANIFEDVDKTANYYDASNATEITPEQFANRKPVSGDAFEYGDYMYVYGFTPDDSSVVGWNVYVTDKTKSEYGPILSKIAGEPVVTMYHTFAGCTNLVESPEFPNNVRSLNCTFSDCTSLITVSRIPSSVTCMLATFSRCSNLTGSIMVDANLDSGWVIEVFKNTVKSITLIGKPAVTGILASTATNNNITTDVKFNPNKTEFSIEDFGRLAQIGDKFAYGDYEYELGLASSTGWSVSVKDKTKTEYGKILKSIGGMPVTEMGSTFSGCKNMVVAPEIPEGIVSIWSAFDGCTSLTTVFVIPSSIERMVYAFNGCTALTGEITINTNTDMYFGCFEGTTQPITITGTSNQLANMASTANNGNVTVKAYQPDIPTGKTEITLEEFGHTPVAGEIFEYNGYRYSYEPADGGWAVRTADKGKVEYDTIFTKIAGTSVALMPFTFSDCTNMVVSPIIPGNILYGWSIFNGCTSLTTIRLACNSQLTMDNLGEHNANVVYVHIDGCNGSCGK